MELSRRDAFRPCSRDCSGDKGQFCFHYTKQKKVNWNRPPLPFLGYMSSSAIWLLQNFSPTTYRPPLPSRLLIRYLKPSKSTTNQFFYHSFGVAILHWKTYSLETVRGADFN